MSSSRSLSPVTRFCISIRRMYSHTGTREDTGLHGSLPGTNSKSAVILHDKRALSCPSRRGATRRFTRHSFSSGSQKYSFLYTSFSRRYVGVCQFRLSVTRSGLITDSSFRTINICHSTTVLSSEILFTRNQTSEVP